MTSATQEQSELRIMAPTRSSGDMPVDVIKEAQQLSFRHRYKEPSKRNVIDASAYAAHDLMVKAKGG